MSEFKDYIKTVRQPMRPYIAGEDLQAQGVSVWAGDIPEVGGMIAVNPKNPSTNLILDLIFIVLFSGTSEIPVLPT